MGYTTVTFVKILSQIKYDDLGFSDESSYDSFIQQLIDYASSLVDDYCGQSFAEPVPQTVRLVTSLIVLNILHMMLQKKINPIVQTANIIAKIVESEAFTDGLKIMLKPYKRVEVLKG